MARSDDRRNFVELEPIRLSPVAAAGDEQLPSWPQAGAIERMSRPTLRKSQAVPPRRRKSCAGPSIPARTSGMLRRFPESAIE